MEFELTDIIKSDFDCGEVDWPERCRNCQYVFPKEMRVTVTKKVSYEDKNIMKAVSETFLESGINRYCCINNFRPNIIRNFVPNIVKDTFNEIYPGVYVDKSMIDWMDIRWDDDDDEEIDKPIIKEDKIVAVNNTVSLFDL